ncbi:MAG TPA: ribosomal-processing cysteine protease Prp [Candidatus Acidoferrales bacterium]|nr:ribosomal-processing cysteine protease Prp [Candidatus Acidoferrales bacterium]
MKASRSRKIGLEVTYERRKGSLVGFQVLGHAGFARAGRDIVCAAISALVLSTAYGLRVHCRAAPVIADTPARYALSLSRPGNARAQAVLETMVSGLGAIAKSYPAYLRVKQGRVSPS